MRKYLFACFFVGRVVGSIGATEKCVVDLKYPTDKTDDEIRAVLYETHEHISGLRILREIHTVYKIAD